MMTRRIGMVTLGLLFVCQGLLWGQNTLEKVRQAIAAQGAHWTAGENVVSVLSEAERHRLFGFIKPNPALAKTRKVTLPQVDDLPSSLDWRDREGNWVSSVRNQGNCGSCWDFSAVAQVESWSMISNGINSPEPDLSEQYILTESGAGSCGGGDYAGALTFIQQQGVPPEAFLPYYANDSWPSPALEEPWISQVVRIPDWGYVTLGEPDVETIKQALMYHPVSANYTVYEDFSYYQSGVYRHVFGDEVAGHAILIVGWSDADSCWICKNSWGPYWGENGYFRIEWGDSGIGNYIPFIYDHHTDSAPLSLSQERFDLTLQPGETYEGTLWVENPGAEPVSYSLIDDQVPLMFHPDTFMAWQGQSLWCGDPAIGGYDDHWLQYLDMDPLDIASASQPVLTLQARWAIENPATATSPWDGWDGWNVWISDNGGQDFTILRSENVDYDAESLWSFGDDDQGWGMGTGIPGWAGFSGGWRTLQFDLSAHRSTQTVVRIAFASDMGFSSQDDARYFGLIVDDIEIKDGSRRLFLNQGESLAGLNVKGEGSMAAEWLALDQAVGTIDPGASLQVGFSVNTEGLANGQYEGLIHLILGDDARPEIQIPVSLRVGDVPSAEPPEAFQITQNYPNPFNQGTQMTVDLPEDASAVSLEVFDSMGRRVRLVTLGALSAGTHPLNWDGTDQQGAALPSGVYVVQISADGRRAVRKVCLVK